MVQTEKKGLFTELEQMRILLIDDDEWIRDSLHVFFESEGCRIITVETAEEALAQLENSSFDIIFIDYMLPGMSGLEFIKRLREPMKAMKILITAYGSKQVLAEAIRIGIQDYIEKPFNTNAIEQSLARLLNVRDTEPWPLFMGMSSQGEKLWHSKPQEN